MIKSFPLGLDRAISILNEMKFRSRSDWQFVGDVPVEEGQICVRANLSCEYLGINPYALTKSQAIEAANSLLKLAN